MINKLIEKEIDKVAQRSPIGVLSIGAMKEFGQTIAKEVAMKFKKGLIEIGHKTHCLKCNRHLAAGECECGGSNCLQKPHNIHRNRLKTLAFYY